MKRLVVFGCGYIGAVVAREGLARGLRVTALTRNAVKASLLSAAGIDTIVADLADDGWHERIAGSPDYVLNAVSSGGGGAEGYQRSYVDGMASIAAWARRRGAVDTLVYTSSTSVYPQGGGALVDESASTAAAGERGQLLLAAESRLQLANAEVPGSTCWRRWFILRLAGIYGPERQHLVDQVRSGEVAGVGEHHLNLVHRDDIAAAIWACFMAPATVANEIFNVVDDGGATRAEITSVLATQLGVPSPRFSSQPAGQRRTLTPDRVIANEKLKNLLGWRPRFSTFREGYANLLSR